MANNIQGIQEFPTITGIQDFVLNILERKEKGFFVEVGAFHSERGNNTHILERNFNWQGFALDIVPAFVKEYNENRTNPCILHDAVSFDYKKYFEENNFPKQMDFLQIDIDSTPGSCTSVQNLLALIQVPLNEYRFSVITFEHDMIENPKNKTVRDAQREILLGLGYALVVQLSYEDWWVDPKIIPKNIYQRWHQNSIGN
jgi:hypothetical protein